MDKSQKKGESSRKRQEHLKRDYQLDNFVIQSRHFLQSLPQVRTPLAHKNNKMKVLFEDDGYKLNGVYYFINRRVLNQEAEVLEDCHTVRGDNFYLKKGESVIISAIISQQYSQIYHKQFCGYFPSRFFRLKQYNNHI